MKKFLLTILAVPLFAVSLGLFAPSGVSAGACDDTSGRGFFKVFPTWYEYLGDKLVTIDGTCVVEDFAWGDLWKIALAVLEMGLRLAGLVATGYVVYGGFKYVLSKGNAQEAARARQTVIDALIGVAIATVATAVVSFLGGQLG